MLYIYNDSLAFQVGISALTHQPTAAPAGSESALSSCMVCAHSSAPWLQAALRRSTTRIWGLWGLWASAQTGHGLFWDPRILGIQDGQELTS